MTLHVCLPIVHRESVLTNKAIHHKFKLIESCKFLSPFLVRHALYSYRRLGDYVPQCRRKVEEMCYHPALSYRCCNSLLCRYEALPQSNPNLTEKKIILSGCFIMLCSILYNHIIILRYFIYKLDRVFSYILSHAIVFFL